MNEPNHHSRNLKVISVFFILYWLLELTPSGDNQIKLQFISYEIHNPSLLMPISWVLLFYFAFRFWLSSRGKFLKQFTIQQRSIANGLLSKRLRLDSDFNDRLLCKAEKHYIENYKVDFENSRAEKKPDCKNTYSMKLTHSFYGFKKIEAQAIYEENISNLHFMKFSLPVSLYPIQIIAMIKSFIRVGFLYEDGPDYFWPWLLFVMACISGLCINFDISVDALLSGSQQLDNAQIQIPSS